MPTDYQFPLQVMEKGARLGYAPDNLTLLFLVPFVQVAWAEGFVQASEQVAAASRATVVREAWSAGRELTVSGLVSDRRNIPLADFQIRVGAEDSAREKCAAAIADFERRWKLRP